MNQTWKAVLTCLLCMICLMILASESWAQVGSGFLPLWCYPSFSNQPLQVPTWEDPFVGEGDILVDNFEYWDSPYNHGWIRTEPAYPFYGWTGVSWPSVCG